MTTRDDYLHDRSGEPDPTIEQLEHLLAPFAHRGSDLPLDRLPAQRPAPHLRWPWVLAAAAAVLGLSFAFWPDDGVLAEGDAPRQFAATTSPQIIRLGTLATLTLQPGSEVRFEHWRKDQALFALQRGSIEARVAPYPAVQAGFFQVETGFGRVIDQGCQYVLSVDQKGARVQVTDGAVTFAFPQRTVFVPAGASTIVGADTGPSTPLFDACSAELRKAVRYYDEVAAKSRQVKAGGSDMRLKGLEMVRQHCREGRDSLPLWHMLDDADETVRDQAEEALLELIGPPPGGQTKGAHWEPDIWLAFLRSRW